MAPKRRFPGGYQQRAAAAQREADRSAAANGTAPVLSVVVNYLVMQWPLGHSSPQQVQHLTKHCETDINAAIRTGVIPHGIEKLTRIGTGGQYSNRCHTELIDALESPQLAQPLITQIPYNIGPRQWRGYEASFWLPHEVFASIHEHYPDAWQQRIIHDHAAIRNFWDQMEDNPMMVGHPIRDKPNDRNLAIPIAMHGDGVPVTGVGKNWRQMMDFYTWCSCLGRGATLDFNFYIWGVFDRLLSTDPAAHTMNAFWELLAWSFDALFSGNWPTLGPIVNGVRWRLVGVGLRKAGHFLANGYFGAHIYTHVCKSSHQIFRGGRTKTMMYIICNKTTNEIASK